ncbi:MAG: fibronectin type III domain-containing protein, partial [Lachnospiraceae bacterium]|nr:fibronectin type III domain-containing protein [Lachnospiraceae bacterium]
MGSRKELYINFKRITTWLMIIALGINCFSTYIYTPVVYANNIFEENTVEESTVEEHITADEHTEKIEDTDGKSNSLDKSDNVTEDNILQEKTEDLLQSTEKNMPKDIEISDENVSAVSNDGMEDFFGDNGVIHGNYENSAPIKLIEDVTIQGTFTVNYPVMLNGHTLYVNGDVIINDYLYVNGDLNIGCNLKINKGYLIFIGGRLTCNGSFLDVGEDFKAISMQSDSDYLYVGGDFILAEKSALQTSISAGIIRLDGDFTQRAYVNYDKYTYGEGNFIMSGSSSLILSGTEPQNIFIGKESSGFNVIEVDAEGLYEDENGKLDFGNRRIGFSGLFNCNNYIDNGCPTTYGYAVYDELAIDDRTYNWEYFYGSIYYVGDPLKLEKKYVGIIGDLILDGDMSISYTTMYIFGSLRIQSVDNNGNYGSTNASLSADERSYMYIYGDFVTESNADHSELLTEGWWYVYGSIRQIGKYAKNLVFRESTHLILNKYIDDKDKEIHITMDNPIGNPIGKYFTNYAGTIVIDSGAVFDYPRGTGNYKGEVWIASDQDFVDLNGPGRIVAPVTIGTVFSSYDVIVDADLEILRTFNIFGDIIVNNGTFKLGTNNTHVMANNVIFPDGCTAMLDMQEAGSFLECDNFTYGSCLPSGKLTDGRIICREKFIVNNTGAEDNFVTSDNHRVDMSGSKGYIDIKNPKSCIENVYCSDVVIASDTTTIHNITPNSKPIVKGGIEGYILEHDEIIEGDMILARGCLDLNGHSLTVLGDVYAVSGDIKLNGGAFNVKGNLNFAYRMVEEDKVTVMPSSAYLHMDNDKDIVNIEGDIYANVNRYSNSWLNYAKAGSIRLAGDMLVEANAGGSNSSEQINVCNGTSLYLIGNRKHTLKASSFTVNMTLDDLIIEDNNSVETDYNIQVNGYIDLTNGKNRINKLTLTSQQNELSGYFNGNLELHDGVLADDLHVTGELDIMGELDLAGNKLYAKGINIHGGTFLNGGEMVADELLKLYGKLIMTDSNDIVRTKDMYVYLSEDITDYMTEGTIYINGDFRDTTYESRKFTPSGNSLVVFEASQSSTHYITLENEKSRFKKAEFVTPVKGYVINRSAYEIADEIIASYKDDIPPTAPQKVTGKEDYLVVMLSWEESADDNLLDHYEIIRDGKTVGTTKDTNYSDSVLKPGTDYEYIIKAVDAVGNYSEESIEYVGITKEDKVKPWRIHTPTPKVEKDSFTIDLTNVFIDNVGVDYYVINKDGAEVARLPEYLIYEYMTDDGAKQKIEINTEHPIYEDGGLKYGSKNKYSVYAVDMTGRRSEETYTFIVYPDYAPKAPDDVKVISENGYNTITISGNDIYDCEAYQILRNGDVIAEIKCNEGYDSTYIDAETEVGQEVSYNVRGIGHHGTLGELSELQTIITSSDDDMPVIKRLDASINGNVLNENADFDLRVVDAGGVKRVLVSLEKDGQATGLASYETTDIVTYADLRFNINVDELYGEYTLRIEAEDYRGNVMVESKEYKINIAGIAPVNLIRTYPEATNIKLSWEELENVYRYVIEQVNDNGLATKLAITDNTDLTIRGLTPETEYVFRIIAYDKEGVRGLPSRNISVTTTADTTSPEITYVYPNDKIIGYNDKLALQYSDNVGVTSVFAYYRKSGEDTWSVIVENFKDNLDKGILWNKEGLESGTYEVLYRVSDAAGNLSEDIIGSYILKLDGPAIHGFELTPGDWKIKVSWDNFEDNNYIRYQLERIEAERYDSAIGQGINIHGIKGAIIKIGFDEVYYEEVIAPDKEYVYILRAYDIYGNESDEIVRGRAIDKDPIPPIIDGVFDMFTSTDTPFVLSAEGCTDNDEIISYMWEMGNGDVVTGMECEYVYQNPGSYNVTLTVTDRGGNSTSQTTSVLVGKDVGQVQVTVKSGGKRIEGASVAACINGEIYSDDSKGFTDSKGMVTLTLPEGDFQITACKENYEFYYDIVTVKKGERTKVEISLNENSPITMDTKVKEMTQKEIKDAGLDISTVGKNVYKMDIDLTYKSEKIHTVMLSLDKDIELVKDGVSGGWSGGSPYLSNGAGSYSGSSGGGSGYTSETIRISNISPDPENPVFIITKTVPVSISWMKNVYQVDVTLTNNGAEIFRLVKATAALELSKELHVVTSSKKKSNEWEINELKGGESAEHTWYVTGDKSGSYPFGLTLDGTIMPNDYEFHETLLSRNNIEITTGEGLHLYIYPESEAYIGENYYIQYRLVNESDRDFYYVTTDFGAFRSADRIQKARTIVTQGEDSESVEHVTDTGVQYFVPEEAVGKARVILQNADSMTLEKLKPGDNVYGTYVFQFNAMGNRRKQYYNLVTAYSDEMNANGMGLQVTLIPVIGHLSETVAELKLPAKKKKNDQTGTGNTGNNPYKRPTPVDESYLNSPQTESDTEEVKDPVNLMTGAFTVTHSPVAVSGGMDFRFNMSYDSRYTKGIGELGHGWHHNYEMDIEHNGSLITLHTTSDDIMYFAESDETANVVSGTVDGDQIILSAEDNVDRTYYQTGDSTNKYVIRKMGNSYILTMGTDTYTFDTEGVLTGYRDGEGKELIISRNEEALTITDAATGKRITAGYNEDGRITSVTDPAGNETKLDYENDCLTTLTAKDGNVLSYTYDDKGHILTGSEGERVYVENTYDSDGRVTSQISNGDTKNKTAFVYETDEDGNVTAVMTNADGTTEAGMSDKYGHGLQYKNAIGGVRKYLYNEQGDMTEFSDMDGSGK